MGIIGKAQNKNRKLEKSESQKWNKSKLRAKQDIAIVHSALANIVYLFKYIFTENINKNTIL